MPADFEVPVVFIAHAEDGREAREKVAMMLHHLENLDQLMPYMVKRGVEISNTP